MSKKIISENLSIREIAKQLWSLLDSIDTLSDICKPTEKDPKAAMAFYNNAMKYVGERFKLLQSDGDKIYTKEEFEALNVTQSLPSDDELIELAKSTCMLHKTSNELGFLVTFDLNDLRKFCNKIIEIC